MNKLRERITRMVAPLPRTFALLLAILAAGGAWAVTVTTAGNAGDDVTVVNSSNNAGGYSWNNSASIKLKVPASSTLVRGALVEIRSVEFVDIGSQNGYCTPSSMTIMGFTATKNTDTAYDTSVFGTHNNAGSWKFAKYSFAEGSRPIMTVDVPEYVSFEFPNGYSNLRALPTNQNADGGQVVILDNSGYSPCTRITGKIVAPTPYTATPTSSSVNISEIEWTPSKEGTDDADATYIIDATNLTTLNLDESFAANTIFIDKSSSGTINITQSNSSTLSATNIVISTGLVVNFGANTSLSVVGGTVAGSNEIGMNASCTFNLQNVYCPAKLNVWGTLNASGNTYLTTANPFQVGCKLNVVDGVTELTNRTDGNNGFSGNIDIAEGAKLIIKTTDGLAYNRSNTIDVHGTLEFDGTQRWTIGTSNTINLHNNGRIKGAGDGNGTLDYNCGNGTINVDGDAAIEAVVNVRGNTVTFNIAEDNTLTWSGGSKVTAGGVNKTGAGTLDVTAATSCTGTATVSAGRMIMASAPSFGTISIADGAMFTLRSDLNGSSTYTGTGTLELENTSGNKWYLQNTAFSGIIKTKNSGGNYWIGGANSNGGLPPLFSGTPELIAESGTQLLNRNFNGSTLSVRDLSGNATFSVGNIGTSDDDTDADVTRTISTKQTKPTTFGGVFSSSGNTKTALKVCGEDESADVYSLTLTGVNTTTGPLDIDNMGKVVFSSTGKWSGGVVTVKDGGVLESQNSEAIAPTLKVEEGATLAFSNGVQLSATAYDWSSVTTDESVKIDLSAIAPSATPVTLIASGVTLAAGKFIVTAAQRTVTLSVESGALKATFPNYWHDGSWDGAFVSGDDATLYISQNSTLSFSEASSLGAVTVVKEGEGNVELTISGAGALTTGGWTIPEGVTVNTPASMTISGTVSGGGVLNVPANTTLEMNGVTCSTKVTVSGTLETRGTTTLSAANTSAAGSLIHVVGGSTTLSSAYLGIAGNITIDDVGELIMSYSLSDGANVWWQHFNPYGNTCVDISGRLNMMGYIWFFGANTTVILREDAYVTGYGREGASNYGNWAWLSNGNVHAYGNAEINVPINSNSGASPVFTVEENKTLTVSCAFTPQNGSYYAGGSITKAGAGTLKLSNVAMTKPIHGSEGTVWLDAAGTKLVNTATGSTFSGVLKLTNTDTTQNNFEPSNATCFTDDARPEFALNSTETYFNTYYSGKRFYVRNFSGSGNFRAQYTSGTYNFYINTMQTKDTEFSGVFNADGTRVSHLEVVGSGSAPVHKLTLSGVNTSTGTLTVSDYAKVVFSGSGSWLSGTTTVKSGGVLESQRDAQVVGALTLEEGSVLAFTDDSKKIQAGAVTLPTTSGAKVVIDVSGLTIGNSESKELLTAISGLENANKFSLDSATHMLSIESGTLKIIPTAATLTYNGTTIPYSTADGAITALGVYVATYPDAYVTLVNATASDVTEDTSAYVCYEGTYGLAAATISSTTYQRLSLAVAASSAGDTITLLRNVAETDVDTTGKQFTFAESTYTFSGSFTGGGIIKMTAKPKSYTATSGTNNGSMFASGWTGTFQVAWKPGNKRFVLDDFGNANSTVEIVGVNGDFDPFPYSQWSGGGAPTVNTKVAIAADTTWTVSDGSAGPGYITTFPLLTGGGNLTVNGTGSGDNEIYYNIQTVSGYTGTLAGRRGYYTIGNIVYDGTPASGICFVKCKASFAPNLTATKINNTAYTLCYDTLNSVKGIYIAVAQVGSNRYASIANAVAAAGDNGTITILENMSSVTVGSSQTVVVASGVTVGAISWGSEYATATGVIGDGTTSYTHTSNAATTYYWTGATDSAWGTIGNWKVGSSDGPVATRAVENSDSVVFNDGANVTLDSSMTVAGIAVNGAVTITASSKELKTSGDITGTGTLTFVDVCLSSMASGLTIAPNVEFTADSELGGDYPFTINGNVHISGRFPQWGSTSVINGSVTVASGANICTSGTGGALTINGTTTFNGAFTKSGAHLLTLGAVSILSTTTPTISGGSISLTGAVTIQTGATFTLPASGVTVGAGASFVLAASDAKLVDNGSGASGKVSTSVANSIVVTTSGEGTTTYSVATTTTDTIGEVGEEETITVITPAEGVTSIGLSGVSGKVAIPGTVTKITGVEQANLLLKVTYNANTAYYAILSLDGSGNVSLNRSATVNGVKVQPEPVDTAPIGVSSTTTKPTFGIKTIPGLWYTLWSSDSVSGSSLDGTIDKPTNPIQATSTETAVNNGASVASGVRYYKIVVGTTADDVK